MKTYEEKSNSNTNIKNKIQFLRKRISKKKEKQNSLNSIDIMLTRNNDKLEESDPINNKNEKEDKNNSTEPEKIFPIFNKSKKKASESIIHSENEALDSLTKNNSSISDINKFEGVKENNINETQALSLIETDSFFLTSKQKQWKMQQKLRKEVEESYKFHSSFAQGKAIHTFFELARTSSRQNSVNSNSQVSIDSSSKSFSENAIKYPTTFMEAAYPTYWNIHLILLVLKMMILKILLNYQI
ncbi:hypothetical protein LY90DRAFT_669566 [Neocallimastix californiae]|uniref:Uncharacterized protein n=1 Tax=Neocallimastix californiae TaxID=1754190 RepID=A0A1Y2D954_9FUNG|nr:hypothetical protein LY90DRAFT_669566 [Neocallimastix californiae]|eukprot:ORY55778.1 hypothetical protein LY90DRAFT_669566 [Neocallimastix californiae]